MYSNTIIINLTEENDNFLLKGQKIIIKSTWENKEIRVSIIWTTKLMN